ncbi:hypothetical protein PAPYR_11635 [Paratrimastix pyriformis]|uniref:BRCT domain-containing protein n=1 Tax=Paratrimastix pyriformis TaxID=342808 RepID=A0ABQ8U8W5_9EUKA|nr:hypothetical protein PAPYR_11635 [Paratrimastix pyriformis]
MASLRGSTVCFEGRFGRTRAILTELVNQNGGCVASSVSTTVSHFIATPEVVQKDSAMTVKAHSRGVPIVSDEWLDACVKTGSLVDPAPFIVEVDDINTNEKPGQTIFKDGDLEKMERHPVGPRGPDCRPSRFGPFSKTAPTYLTLPQTANPSALIRVEETGDRPPSPTSPPPLAHYVNRIRMERALFLLAHRADKNMTDITYELGFTDSAVFSRTFKNYFIGKVFANGYVKNKVMEFVGPGVENMTADFRIGIDLYGAGKTELCLRAASELSGDPEITAALAPHGPPAPWRIAYIALQQEKIKTTLQTHLLQLMVTSDPASPDYNELPNDRPTLMTRLAEIVAPAMTLFIFDEIFSCEGAFPALCQLVPTLRAIPHVFCLACGRMQVSGLSQIKQSSCTLVLPGLSPLNACHIAEVLTKAPASWLSDCLDTPSPCRMTLYEAPSREELLASEERDLTVNTSIAATLLGDAHRSDETINQLAHRLAVITSGDPLILQRTLALLVSECASRPMSRRDIDRLSEPASIWLPPSSAPALPLVEAAPFPAAGADIARACVLQLLRRGGSDRLMWHPLFLLFAALEPAAMSPETLLELAFPVSLACALVSPWNAQRHSPLALFAGQGIPKMPTLSVAHFVGPTVSTDSVPSSTSVIAASDFLAFAERNPCGQIVIPQSRSSCGPDLWLRAGDHDLLLFSLGTCEIQQWQDIANCGAQLARMRGGRDSALQLHAFCVATAWDPEVRQAFADCGCLDRPLVLRPGQRLIRGKGTRGRISIRQGRPSAPALLESPPPGITYHIVPEEVLADLLGGVDALSRLQEYRTAPSMSRLRDFASAFGGAFPRDGGL